MWPSEQGGLTFLNRSLSHRKEFLLVLSGSLLTEMNEVFLLYAVACPYSTPSGVCQGYERRTVSLRAHTQNLWEHTYRSSMGACPGRSHVISEYKELGKHHYLSPRLVLFKAIKSSKPLNLHSLFSLTSFSSFFFKHLRSLGYEDLQPIPLNFSTFLLLLLPAVILPSFSTSFHLLFCPLLTSLTAVLLFCSFVSFFLN